CRGDQLCGAGVVEPGFLCGDHARQQYLGDLIHHPDNQIHGIQKRINEIRSYMEIIFLLIGISLVLAVGFLFLFFRAMKSGQYDDSYTPSVRILFDQKTKSLKNNTTSTKSK